MSKLIDIDDERFWDILFDEACVEGRQAERIKNELEKIVAFDTEKVVERLEKLEDKFIKAGSYNVATGLNKAIDIVKKGGVE